MNDTTPVAVTSRADVSTDEPARYAEQLVSHLGRMLDLAADGAVPTAAVGGGTGQVVIGDGVPTLLAAGPDEAAVATVEPVLGNHLLRFATREDLTATWTRTTAHATPA